MDDAFEKRVQAAATSGWWCLLIAVACVVISWIAYLIMMSVRPSWYLSLCGPDVSWDTLQSVWIFILILCKLFLWLLALVVIWLTLWARQLRKRADGGS